MKSVVKLVKSLHVETPVLNVMFLCYFVLLIASATIIARGMSGSAESSVTATKNTSATHQLKN